MKVLFILNNAPSYKESFLRKLGESVDLTVLAEKNNKYANNHMRKNYEYIEIESANIFLFRYQKGLKKYISDKSFDIIICSWNLRYFDRYIQFILSKEKNKWIWWGHIYGKTQSLFLDLVRKLVFNKSKGVLVYSKQIRNRLQSNKVIKPVVSFNNSEVSKSEFRKTSWNNDNYLKLLFVGRYQKRKKLYRLIEILERYNFIKIMVVGSGMHENFSNHLNNRLIVKDARNNNELDEEFSWCDSMISPGHLGLMILNAARYGKPVIIFKNDTNAPEINLAYDADQIFIDYENKQELDQVIDKLQDNKEILMNKGNKLQEVAKQYYNVEYMVEQHLKLINL